MLEPKCNICKQIKREILEKGSSQLERRLYNCRKFNPRGPETQSDIAREFGFAQVSMSKHLKFHQNPNEQALVNERFERNIERQAKYVSVQDTILEKGLQQIEDGEIKLNASTIATVARDKMNQEERNKDRQVKVMEMIWAFNSGELDAGGNSTLRASGDLIEG